MNPLFNIDVRVIECDKMELSDQRILRTDCFTAMPSAIMGRPVAYFCQKTVNSIQNQELAEALAKTKTVSINIFINDRLIITQFVTEERVYEKWSIDIERRNQTFLDAQKLHKDFSVITEEFLIYERSLVCGIFLERLLNR